MKASSIVYTFLMVCMFALLGLIIGPLIGIAVSTIVMFSLRVIDVMRGIV